MSISADCSSSWRHGSSTGSVADGRDGSRGAEDRRVGAKRERRDFGAIWEVRSEHPATRQNRILPSGKKTPSALRTVQRGRQARGGTGCNSVRWKSGGSSAQHAWGGGAERANLAVEEHGRLAPLAPRLVGHAHARCERKRSWRPQGSIFGTPAHDSWPGGMKTYVNTSQHPFLGALCTPALVHKICAL